MATYTATHSIVCPFQVRGQFNEQTGMFDIVPCGKKFTGRATSEVSQAAADNEAEAKCYARFNGHVHRSHSR